MTKIAFIGLGNMGRPMAANLIKHGNEVSGYDRSAAALEAFRKGGGLAAPSAREAVKDAGIVITMLPSGKHLSELYKESFVEALTKSALLIDCSTIDAATARTVAALAASKGLRMIDAPVSGGTAGAKAGTLTFIVGGKRSDFHQAQSILSQMGHHIFHAGEAGAGQIAKICNNMLLAIHMIGTAEALNLGINHGLDPAVLSKIMLKSSGRNWSLEVQNPIAGVMQNTPASNGYAAGFAVDLMTKDLQLAAQLSLNSQTATPMGNTALNLYRIWSQSGRGKLDFSSIVQLLNQA